MTNDPRVVADILPKAARPLACGRCPFCGGKAIQAVTLPEDEEGTRFTYQLECMTCGAAGPRQSILADATRKWNLRLGS